MIDSYIQNSDVGMTKEAYFDMCDALGSEPVDEDTPVELDDFPDTVQQAFSIYFMLKDNWDSMGGGYMGKDTSSLFNFFDLYDIEYCDRLFILSLIQRIDYARSKLINAKLDSKKKPSSKKA